MSCMQIVAIDALVCFRVPQFEHDNMIREALKA